MSVTLKHSARIVVNHADWQRSVRCRIIIKSFVLFAVAFMLSMPAMAAGKASLVPCEASAAPAQKVSSQKPKAMHYRSSAMALSMALGLRSATGPVVHANKKSALAAIAKASPSTMNAITPSSGKQAGSALARSDTGRCVTLSSLE